MDILSFLNRAAESSGLTRTKYIDNNVRTNVSDFIVFPFFGDMRATSILSMLLLRRIKEELKGSKYFILCSWTGFEGLFPYVDEYWSLKDESSLSRIYSFAKGFENSSDLVVQIKRNLNHYFEEMIDDSWLNTFYDKGITQNFMDKFRHIKKFLPSIPSSAILGQEFNRELSKRHGYKIFINPSLTINGWNHNNNIKIKTSIDFWRGLIESLLSEGFVPVIQRSFNSHDISKYFINSCLYVNENNILSVLAGMRATGCVLDIYNDSAKYAIMARCPFFKVEERARFSGMKEYEIDDLFATKLPREYSFGFSNIIENIDKNMWKTNLFDVIINKLKKFIPDLNRDDFPSSGELYEIIEYSNVRKKKIKKLGTKFIKLKGF